MVKMHVVAKAVLTAIGIYIITFMLNFLPYFRSFVFCVRLLNLILNYSLIFLFGLLVYQLIVGSDKWAHKIVGDTQTKDTDDLLCFAISVYRITIVFCGIFLIYHAVPTIEPYIRSHLDPETTYRYGFTIPDVARWLLALYLIFGAPQFVRWHVHRTLKYKNITTNA
jgi:hypothetical protein